MNPSERAWAAEEASINGFPALRQVIFGEWLLRFSNGARRTANSATPLRLPAGDFAEVIVTAEALYRTQGQPTIFRVPSFLPPGIDAELAARGYTAEGESCIIAGPIEAIGAAGDPAEVALSPNPTAAWLAAMAELQGQRPEFSGSYRQVVGSLVVPAAFATLAVDGEPAALAYGAIHRGLLCYESVVTAADHRREGYARRVLAALAGWAQRNGATAATLQVEASNAAGRALYHAVGMVAELHRYHYRREPRA